MPKVVISDTSCLILFQNINELQILKAVYGNIYTTPEVLAEYGSALPKWITIKKVQDKKYQQLLETQIDKGEASAIALAFEINSDLILLDDLKARKLAKELHLKITGTFGIISKAKKLKIIDKVKPLIEKIQKTNFRISKKIINEILRINDEL